jgi:hypothetical protein
MHPTHYLTRKQASQFLRERGLPCSAASLAKMAPSDSGPPMVRWGGRRVLYKTDALERWAASRLVPSLTRSHQIENNEEPPRAPTLTAFAEETA